MKTAHHQCVKRGSLLLLAAILSCTMFLSGCSLLVRPYSISGVVTDARYDQGVQGVTISFSGLTTSPVVTAADGTWTKSGLRGAVTVTPSKTGMVFSPSSRVVKNTSSQVDFSGDMEIKSVYWYSASDGYYFNGTSFPVSPTEDLTSNYFVTEESSAIQTEAPQGYDALVISDVGASFDICDFEGSVIVTFDSSISPLFCWLTGDFGKATYWDYASEEQLEWINPVTGIELGALGDARVYHSLASEPGFTRMNDILEARSTEDADDIIVYKIEHEGKVWWWVHIGPHFGNYDEEVTETRASQILCYTLDVLNFRSPSFPDLPAYPDSPDASSVGSRNK